MPATLIARDVWTDRRRRIKELRVRQGFARQLLDFYGALLAVQEKVYQIGIPIHWGYVGLSADSDPSHGRYWLANALTPFVGDANARTPEFKAFLVNLEKI